MTSTEGSPRLRAVLFDIDGTLVDSNYLHIEAWTEAFAELGRAPGNWAVHQAIGLDSGKLLERLLGDHAEALADRAKELHRRRYEASTDRLRAFPGVRDLFVALRRRGLTIVLASSAPQEELEILLDVLDVSDLIHDATTSSEVETAKPEPDVVVTALRKAGVSADEALLVGDARWDVEAAARAGVDTIGVLSGGRGTAELMEAGALTVYDDVRSLLAHLDDSPIGRRSA